MRPDFFCPGETSLLKGREMAVFVEPVEFSIRNRDISPFIFISISARPCLLNAQKPIDIKWTFGPSLFKDEDRMFISSTDFIWQYIKNYGNL